MTLKFRKATEADVALLTDMNRQLILDENHRNQRLTLPELADRMRGFLRGGYQAIIFEQDSAPVAYALYHQAADGIYLRQFFVDRQCRRRGIGRQAMNMLKSEVWPPGQRITVEVLVNNHVGHEFWKAVGFVDYAVTLEMQRDEPATDHPDEPARAQAVSQEG
jgi:GNAT superfamily N-acetyltransferase